MECMLADNLSLSNLFFFYPLQAHLLNRDYTEIGQDFVNLDFIPKGTDTTPIVPALTQVSDAALAGGGAKSINFQELAGERHL